MVKWRETLERVLGFWRQYRRSKMGIAGLVIILFFVGMSLTAPLIRPWPWPVWVNLAPRLSAPLWLLPLNPLGFSAEYPVTNPFFTTSADGWDYNESLSGESYIVVNNTRFDTNADGWTYYDQGAGAAITNGFYNPNRGSNAAGGSGPGSYEIQYNDSTGAGYGITDAYLYYEFNFDADKYPPGFANAHPSRVIIDYSIQFIIDNTPSELGQADCVFSIEVTNSTGPANVVYRRTYFTTGVIPWIQRTRNMPLENCSLTFTATDVMAVQFHLAFRNPIGADTPQMVIRLDDVQLSVFASYNDTTSNHLIEGQYSSTVGSDDSGPGSYLFTYADLDNLTSYQNAYAWIQSSFTWDFYERPNEAFLRYNYVIQSLGDWGDAYINIIQECYVEVNGHTEVILRSDNIYDDRSWTASPEKVWDTFMVTNTFGERGTLWVRIKIQVSDPTPQDTPSFNIYFDDIDLEVLGNYYGELGAGQYGEDLFSQLLWGSRIALLVGLTAAFISTFVGLIVGLIAGYFGGLVDEILMRVTDFFLIIPGLPLMIVLAAILEPRWWNIVLVIALIGWTGTARLVRAQVLAERQRAYVEAARAIGASDLYIIFRHILPNVTPLLFAQITLGVAGAILSEAGLSFLGLTHPYDVSWGRMLFQASGAGAYSEGAWWYVFFPGVCIVLLALSFTLVGYAVDEILNPRLRIRRQ
ncbi:MAG: ABC transporter permease [Candidatus Hodarchaeota archaeon]